MDREPADVAIRKAQIEDADALIDLVLSLAEYERLPPPDEAARARLVADAFSDRPRFEVYLAEVEGRIAGYAFVFETYSTFLALPTLYLEDLFVLPEFRGRKAGYALMKHLAAEAIRRGCGRLEWTVLDWNTPAIEFYNRLGARHMAEWYFYRLDRDGLQELLDGARS